MLLLIMTLGPNKVINLLEAHPLFPLVSLNAHYREKYNQAFLLSVLHSRFRVRLFSKKIIMMVHASKPKQTFNLLIGRLKDTSNFRKKLTSRSSRRKSLSQIGFSGCFDEGSASVTAGGLGSLLVAIEKDWFNVLIYKNTCRHLKL